LNVGFVLSQHIHALKNYNQYIFHDVDMIPLEKEYYTIDGINLDTTAVHLATMVSQFGYKMPYPTYFGGVTYFSKKVFEKVNGFSNQYNGWGCEDDDLYLRVLYNQFDLKHKRYCVFESLDHPHNGSTKETQANEKYLQQVKQNPELTKTEGLNTCQFKLLKLEFDKMYFIHALVDYL
jgi:hypothetical protein